MKIFLPLDDRGGMMFARRRQSQDIALRNYILQHCAGAPLHMNAYSAKQFAAHGAPNLAISADFLADAGDGFCFVEDQPLAPYAAQIETLYLCRWNRSYPSDVRFDLALADGWTLCSSTDIIGKSHEKITIEEWCHHETL